MSKAKSVINELDDDEKRKERVARQESIYAIHRKYYQLIESVISSFEKGLESAVTELSAIEDDVTLVSNSVNQLCTSFEMASKDLTKRLSKKKVKELMGK